MATNSDIQAGTDTEKVVSPKQLKDSINEAVTGAIIYKGQWDLSEGLDFFEDQKPIKQGWRWEATGDTITIEGVEISATDFATFNTDVGVDDEIDISMIDITDNTDRVLSVNGQTGDVVVDVEDASSRLIVVNCYIELNISHERYNIIPVQADEDKLNKHLTDGREYLFLFEMQKAGLDFDKMVQIKTDPTPQQTAYRPIYSIQSNFGLKIVDLKNLFNEELNGSKYRAMVRTIYYNNNSMCCQPYQMRVF